MERSPTPTPVPSPPGHPPAPSRAHAATRAALLVLAGAVFVQHYAAGLGLIAGRSMRFHAILGWLLILATLVTTLLLLLSRVTRRVAAATGLALLLFIAQPLLIFGARPALPGLAALHAATGLAALGVLLWGIRRLRAD